MHLTDIPLQFNKRDWATCRNREYRAKHKTRVTIYEF